MIQGQIIRGTNMGEIIYNLAKRSDVNDIVEIGTWYGLGSTKCIIDGIIDSNQNKKFISLELYQEMYDVAMTNLKDFLKYVTIINGSIINYEDMFWFDFIDNQKRFGYQKEWYDNDLEKMKTTKNVLEQIPPKIDLLILDGGEFSTYPEWLKLKDRTKIVVLDDTNVFKCNKILHELLKDKNYKPLHVVYNDRNGFAVFEKKKININMEKIQINYLAHNPIRTTFSFYSLDYLKKIKNKDRIFLVIYPTRDLDKWIIKTDELNNSGIKTELISSVNKDYLFKINHSIKSNCKFSCKMDEDILITNPLWDYIIDNIEYLENDNILFLSPIISNGIPSVDFFIEFFMNKNDKEIMHNIFKNTNMPNNLWGVNYSNLNDSTLLSSKWDYDFYYKLVDKIDHYYKGIHPVRISFIAQMKLAEIIIRNYKDYIENTNYDIFEVKRPYFCNSFFFIKTDTWKNIIQDKELFKDPFDEVPLNLYMKKNDLNMSFIKNGFCIHMSYNTIGIDSQNIIQDYYFKNLL